MRNELMNGNNGVQTISSREVAKIMGVREHSKMLRKIDGLNEILNKTNVASSKYWFESTYKAGNGEMRREYRVTRKGFEFIVSKSRGNKSNEYLSKFDAVATGDLVVIDQERSKSELKQEKNSNVKTISSREVAKMLEAKHDDMLRKIDILNERLNDAGICSSKYWYESTYKQSGNGKECREYQVTENGCRFILLKSMGKKGVIFTVKYMERFEEMEKALKKQAPSTYIEALEQLFDSEKQKQKLSIELKEEQDKNNMVDVDALLSNPDELVKLTNNYRDEYHKCLELEINF